MSFPYADIVNLPHPVSARHAPMSDADRAAQFSPFAALNGHGDAIRETARLTDCRAELDENEKALLNEKLLRLRDHLKERPLVTLTVFVRDLQKEGGAYVTLAGIVKKIDEYTQTLVMEDGERIPIWDVYNIAANEEVTV